MSTPEIILHGTELSGHTHRVELLLRQSVLAWLCRVESLPHFKPIPPSPIPAAE